MVRKTALITAATVAGVVLAGGAAVGANVSILNADDSSAVGQLAAEGASTTSTTSTTSVPPAARTQSYEVDAAGMVNLEISEQSIGLGDVSTNAGWTWEQTTVTDELIVLKFTTDGDEVMFLATIEDDGTVSAGADRRNPAPTNGSIETAPQVQHQDQGSTGSSAPATAAPSNRPATAAPSNGPGYVGGSDDSSYDDHDDHDDDESDHDDGGHEGRDEDD